MRPAFLRDLAIISIVSLVVFGGIAAYYQGAFRRPSAGQQVMMPPVVFAPVLSQEDSLDIAEPDPLDDLLTHNSTLYRNDRLGFSLLLPKEIISLDGGCTQSGSVARVHSAAVAVRAYEEGDRVIIAQAESWTTDGRTCTRWETTPDTLADFVPHYRWTITGFRATDQEDIDRWLTEALGPGCRVLSLTPAPFPGVQQAEISRYDEECMNYANFKHLLYMHPERGRGLFFALGQEAAFWRSADERSYDLEMLASLRVE